MSHCHLGIIYIKVRYVSLHPHPVTSFVCDHWSRSIQSSRLSKVPQVSHSLTAFPRSSGKDLKWSKSRKEIKFTPSPSSMLAHNPSLRSCSGGLLFRSPNLVILSHVPSHIIRRSHYLSWFLSIYAAGTFLSSLCIAPCSVKINHMAAQRLTYNFQYCVTL